MPEFQCAKQVKQHHYPNKNMANRRNYNWETKHNSLVHQYPLDASPLNTLTLRSLFTPPDTENWSR